MTHYTARVLDDRRLELPAGALRQVRPGQNIEIDLEESDVQTGVRPNELALAMLRDVVELTKALPETDPSQTDRQIREARGGAMYGCEPLE